MRTDRSAQPRKLPEYLEAHEVEAIIRATDNPSAKLLMMEQWRAGLRVAEALAIELADLSLDAGVVEIGSLLREHQPGKTRRRSPFDGVALGQGGGQEG